MNSIAVRPFTAARGQNVAATRKENRITADKKVSVVCRWCPGVVRISGALRQRGYYAMTFLLFLISLAVLEYIVRRPEAAPKTGWQPLAKQRAEERPADSAPALTPGLLALGQALDQRGRGQTPGTTAKTPEVPRPQADRV
jgi:hypothetical protein